MPVARDSSACERLDAFSFRRTSASVGAAFVVLAGGVGAADIGLKTCRTAGPASAVPGSGTVSGGVGAGVAAGVGAGALVLSFVCSKSSARRMTSGFSWCPKSEAN